MNVKGIEAEVYSKVSTEVFEQTWGQVSGQIDDVVNYQVWECLVNKIWPTTRFLRSQLGMEDRVRVRTKEASL